MGAPDLTSLLFDGKSLEEDLFGDSVDVARELSAAAPPPPRPLSTPWAEQTTGEKAEDLAQDVRRTPQFSAVENVGSSLMSNMQDETAAGMMTSDEMYGPDKVQGYQSPYPAGRSTDNTYAAGSEEEDLRRTFEAEKDARDDTNPKSALLGNVIGGATAAAALPQSLGAQVAGNAGMIGANLIGSGSGDLGNRVGQAADYVQENPKMTAAMVAAPLVPGAVRALGRGASKALNRSANINTTVAGMTAPQRTGIIDNSKLSRGEDPLAALDALGGDIRARDLHKRPWHEFWKPGFDAETLANNAVKLQHKAERGLETTESKLAEVSPPIKYTPISEDLEGAADEVMTLTNKDAAIPEAELMRRQAQYYRDATTHPRQGPIQSTLEEQPFTTGGGDRNVMLPSQVEVQPPFAKGGGGRNFVGTAMDPVEPTFFPSGAGREAPPRVEAKDWFEYLQKAKENPDLAPPLATKPGGVFEGPDRAPEFQPSGEKTFTAEGPERPPELEDGPDQLFTRQGPAREPKLVPGEPLGSVETGEVGWPQAQADLRHGNEQVNHARLGGYKGAPTDEKVQRRINGQLHGQIDEGLDTAVGNGQLQPEDVSDWKGHMKDYGVAATVKDPAMALTQKQYGGSMGMKDLAGTGVLSAFGLPGPAAVMTTKTLQGSWPGMKANAQAFGANIAEGAANNAYGATGAAVRHPVAVAKEENPGAPKSTILQSANEALKEALKSGSDWFSSLTD